MSPLKSQKQRRWMWANRPEMAAQWEADTPKGTKLPERVAKKKRAPLAKLRARVVG